MRFLLESLMEISLISFPFFSVCIKEGKRKWFFISRNHSLSSNHTCGGFNVIVNKILYSYSPKQFKLINGLNKGYRVLIFVQLRVTYSRYYPTR